MRGIACVCGWPGWVRRAWVGVRVAGALRAGTRLVSHRVRERPVCPLEHLGRSVELERHALEALFGKRLVGLAEPVRVATC